MLGWRKEAEVLDLNTVDLTWSNLELTELFHWTHLAKLVLSNRKLSLIPSMILARNNHPLSINKPIEVKSRSRGMYFNSLNISAVFVKKPRICIVNILYIGLCHLEQRVIVACHQFFFCLSLNSIFRNKRRQGHQRSLECIL